MNYLIATLLGLVLITGCAGNDADDPGTNEPGSLGLPEGHIDDQALAAFLGANRSDDVRFPEGLCPVSVYLTSHDDIELYADAGDVVATDPTQTVGVKVGYYAAGSGEPSQSECHSLLTEKLAEADVADLADPDGPWMDADPCTPPGSNPGCAE